LQSNIHYYLERLLVQWDKHFIFPEGGSQNLKPPWKLQILLIQGAVHTVYALHIKKETNKKIGRECSLKQKLFFNQNW